MKVAERLGEARERVREVRERFRGLSEQVPGSKQQLEQAHLQWQRCEQEVTERQQQLEQVHRYLSALQNRSSQLMRRSSELQTHYERAVWEREQIEKQLQHGELLRELESEGEKELQLIEQQVARAKQQLLELGEVNFASLGELQALESRQQLLATQLSDLRLSQGEVMRVIATLDERCRSQFHTTFNLVANAFAHNFNLLFEGGQARLSLTSEEGIEIYGSPPGKQLRSMSLMSGGEKCLSSMAFMFALFDVRPAPFCLLDEIDAPLDDANVERLLKLLNHYS